MSSQKKLNDVVVWESYFDYEILRTLTMHEYFETPSEFKTIFDLVRDEPITKPKHFTNAIIFDFRISNSKQ